MPYRLLSNTVLQSCCENRQHGMSLDRVSLGRWKHQTRGHKGVGISAPPPDKTSSKYPETLWYTILIALDYPLYLTIAEQNIRSKTQAQVHHIKNWKQVTSRATLNERIAQSTLHTRIKYDTWFATGSTYYYSVGSMPVSSFWRPESIVTMSGLNTNPYKIFMQFIRSYETSKYQIAFILYSCMDFCEYYPIYFCTQ